jgi:hypothetical protein
MDDENLPDFPSLTIDGGLVLADKHPARLPASAST